MKSQGGILMNNKIYLCIDLKSFYASVECVERGLDPFKINLVVADPTRGGGAITLAATPAIKQLGVPCLLYTSTAGHKKNLSAEYC